MDHKNVWFNVFKKAVRKLWHENSFRYAMIIFVLTVMGYVLGRKLIKYYGVRPSKRDKRDLKISGVIPSFPSSFELPLPRIKDQKQVSSCCAHSMAYVSEAVLGLDQASVAWIYGYRPSGYYKGEGMYPRDALKTINQVGSVPYVNFPFNEEVPGVISRVNQNLKDLTLFAKPHKSTVFFQTKTDDEIKTCIMKYGPVSIMYPVCKNFENPVNGKIESLGSDFLGYHQVTLYGWQGDYWLMINSWSEKWGNNGIALINKKYRWTEAWGFSTDKDAVVSDSKKNIFIKFWEWIKGF